LYKILYQKYIDKYNQSTKYARKAREQQTGKAATKEQNNQTLAARKHSKAHMPKGKRKENQNIII
jgi:hypothetical protein